MAAGIVGVLLGCLLGMFPLLFLSAPSSHEARQIKREKKRAHGETIPP